MPKSGIFADQALALVFQGVIPPWFDAETLWVSLHIGPPGIGGTQSTAECRYPGYARRALRRDPAAAVVMDGMAENVAEIRFPPCASDHLEVASWLAVGTAESGPGQIIYDYALPDPLEIRRLVAPTVEPGAMKTRET